MRDVEEPGRADKELEDVKMEIAALHAKERRWEKERAAHDEEKIADKEEVNKLLKEVVKLKGEVAAKLVAKDATLSSAAAQRLGGAAYPLRMISMFADRAGPLVTSIEQGLPAAFVASVHEALAAEAQADGYVFEQVSWLLCEQRVVTWLSSVSKTTAQMPPDADVAELAVQTRISTSTKHA